MLVAGGGGLLALALETFVQAVAGTPAVVGESSLRTQTSLFGALTLIGLVAWLIHWWLADRPTRQEGPGGLAERGSAIRKLFLYLALAIGGIILTIAAAAALADVLRGLFGQLTLANLIDGSILEPLSYLVVVGGLELYYAQVASHDRQATVEAGAGATLRRWCVYGLTFFGLMVLLFAAAGVLETLWAAAVVPPDSVSSGVDWLATALAARLGLLTAGLALWTGMWTWSSSWLARPQDVDPETRSVLRKVYLYLVLAVAITWTIWDLGRALHEGLGALLIPERLSAGWGGVIHDLGPSVATVVVFGIAWVYHARVVEREAALAREVQRQASIRWLYAYLVALAGLATLAVGVAGTASTALELLVQPGAARPSDWWQERISLFATFVVVGLPLWTRFWVRLQREATAPEARRSLVRRIYLILVFGLSVLTLLGSGAFTVYQVIRVLLGESWTGGQTSELITAASTVAVAALVLTYHLRAFRWDAREEEGTPRSAEPETPVRALAIVRAATPAAMEAFRARMRTPALAGVEIEVLDLDEEVLRRITAGDLAAQSPPRPETGAERSQASSQGTKEPGFRT